MAKNEYYYNGNVLVRSAFLSKFCPEEYQEFAKAYDAKPMTYESEYEQLITDVNGYKVPSKCNNSRLVKATRKLVEAAKNRGLELFPGYIFDEAEADIVFSLSNSMFRIVPTKKGKEMMKAVGLTMDSMYPDSSAYVM